LPFDPLHPPKIPFGQLLAGKRSGVRLNAEAVGCSGLLHSKSKSTRFYYTSATSLIPIRIRALASRNPGSVQTLSILRWSIPLAGPMTARCAAWLRLDVSKRGISRLPKASTDTDQPEN
jgi:hypothetical protein